MNFIWLLLHSTTTLSRCANCCSNEWITLSLFFDYSLKDVMSSCHCFVKHPEFSAKKSLPQEIKCLFLKESTSAKNDYFVASNSSIAESLNFDNSSLILILIYSLNCLCLFEYWALLGKDKQVRAPKSFICTEWHFINWFRSSWRALL